MHDDENLCCGRANELRAVVIQAQSYCRSYGLHVAAMKTQSYGRYCGLHIVSMQMESYF